MKSNDDELRPRVVNPLVDAAGAPAGIITRGDIVRALDQDPAGAMPVREAGSKSVIVTYPDELLFDAATMLRHNIGRLVVVDRNDPKKIVGYLARSGIMAGRMRRLEEENVREPGWIKRFARR
jgi:CIC family chloride channel protein